MCDKTFQKNTQPCPPRPHCCRSTISSKDIKRKIVYYRTHMYARTSENRPNLKMAAASLSGQHSQHISRAHARTSKSHDTTLPSLDLGLSEASSSCVGGTVYGPTDAQLRSYSGTCRLSSLISATTNTRPLAPARPKKEGPNTPTTSDAIIQPSRTQSE